MTTLPMLTCKRCKVSWVRRIPSLPIACPRCRRKDWNKDKVAK